MPSDLYAICTQDILGIGGPRDLSMPISIPAHDVKSQIDILHVRRYKVSHAHNGGLNMSTEADRIIAGYRNAASPPAFFGLGFIQLKLNDKQRVHFYHPSLQANVPEEELHDHRYDFRSTVIFGELHNEIWEFSPNENGPNEMVKVSCDPKNPLPEGEIKTRGVASKVLEFMTVRGGEYLITNTRFHRVKADKCITSIIREPHVKDFATVIRGTGAPEVCPFDVSMTEAECWDIISEMVHEMCDEVKDPGYHVRKIARGVTGETSKILEEVEELIDAQKQGVKLMELIELSDLMGAVEAYLAKYHPGTTMHDLSMMSKVTRRAFLNGHRS